MMPRFASGPDIAETFLKAKRFNSNENICRNIALFPHCLASGFACTGAKPATAFSPRASPDRERP
jgi:hypothetical protein